MHSDELQPDIDLSELGLDMAINDIAPNDPLRPSDLDFFRRTVRRLVRPMRRAYGKLARNRYTDVTIDPQTQEFTVDFGIVHMRKGLQHKTLEARMIGLIEVEAPPTRSQLQELGLSPDAKRSPQGLPYLRERVAILSAIIQRAGAESKIKYQAMYLKNPGEFGRQIFASMREGDVVRKPEIPTLDGNFVKQIHQDRTGHLPAKLERSRLQDAPVPNIDNREGSKVRWLAHEFAGRARKTLRPYFTNVAVKISTRTHNFTVTLQPNPEFVRGMPYSHLIDASGKIKMEGEVAIALADRMRASTVVLHMQDMNKSDFDLDIGKPRSAAHFAEMITGVTKETPAPTKKAFAKRIKNSAAANKRTNTPSRSDVRRPFSSRQP